MNFAVLIKISTIYNPNAPNAIILDENSLIVGRKGSIRIDTSKGHEISKNHALMKHEKINDNWVWLIQDIQSLNGTFVNGRKISRQVLQNNDEIIFGGGSSLQFRDFIDFESSRLSECLYCFLSPEPPIQFDMCEDLDIVLGDQQEEDECCICYVALHKMQALPCGHSFCSECLHHWIYVCAKSMRPSLCPVCRRPFTRSDVSVEDISTKDGKLVVKSIVPLLRTLKVKSVKELEKYRITAKWSDFNKQQFWILYEDINSHKTLQKVLRHYLDMTMTSLYNVSLDQIKNVVANLDGNQNLTEEREIREEAFSRFASKLLHINHEKNSSNSKKHRFIHFF